MAKTANKNSSAKTGTVSMQGNKTGYTPPPGKVVAGKKTPVVSDNTGSKVTSKPVVTQGRPITGKNRSTQLVGSRPNAIGDTASQTSGAGTWNGPKNVAASGEVLPGYRTPAANSPGSYSVPDCGNSMQNTAAGPVGATPTKKNQNPNSAAPDTSSNQFGTE